MKNAIIASIVVYLVGDALWTFFLKPIGWGDLHALLSMFGGMFVGGFMARRNFVTVAAGIAIVFSLLSYSLVAMMREQSMLDLIVEQPLLISLGSLIGAIIGAMAGMWCGRLHASRSQ